jgi:FkbM family methyltransferase
VERDDQEGIRTSAKNVVAPNERSRLGVSGVELHSRCRTLGQAEERIRCFLMMREPLPAAASDQFRRQHLIEIAGERFRNAAVAPSARAWLKRVYHAALMVQTGGRGLACKLPHGELVRALPEYRHLSWNPAEYNAFRSVVRPGMVALDVGANVGAYSLLLGQWVGPAGKVFAFEPAPTPFNGLVRHVRLNHLERIVHPVPSAVGVAQSTAPLVLASTAGESRLATSAEDQHGTIDVPVTSLDTFCMAEQIAPDFIKVDVEGAELDVLRGARETIRRGRGRLALFVEMHPSVWPTIGVTKADVLAEFASQGLVPASLMPTGDMWAIEGMSLELQYR